MYASSCGSCLYHLLYYTIPGSRGQEKNKVFEIFLDTVTFGIPEGILGGLREFRVGKLFWISTAVSFDLTYRTHAGGRRGASISAMISLDRNGVYS